MFRKKHGDEQLNKKSASVETPNMDFTVDDIVAEFGSAAQKAEELTRKEAEAQQDAEEIVRIWQPKVKKPEPPVEEAPEEVPEEAPAITFDEERWQEDEDEELEEALFSRPKLRLLPRLKQLRSEREMAEEAAPAPEPPTAEELLDTYEEKLRRIRPGMYASWVLAILSLFSMVAALGPWEVFKQFPVPVYNAVTLGLLLVCCITALVPLIMGVQSLLKGRFSKYSMLVFLAIISCIRGFTTLATEEMSLSAVSTMVLTLGVWGEYLLLSAKCRSLKTALEMETPLSAARYYGVYEGKDCLYRRPPQNDTFHEDLDKPPATEKALDIAALLLTALSLTVAGILSLGGKMDFLWIFNALLVGACPVGGFVAYGRTFCKASKYLKSCGAALSGLTGAGHLSGDVGVVLTDDDVFPPANVSLNGIKVFGTETPERLLGFAVALLERSGAKTLTRIFTRVLEDENGRHYRTGDFRTYETGGLGGEIGGNIVLLGSLNFMQMMDVKLPADTRIRQALYISVNGVAEGVFAISYRPSDAVRSGLSAILSCRGVDTVLATRDVLLTSELVKNQYRIPGDYLDYPPSETRATLVDAAEGESLSGAYLARDSFLSFSVAVAVGRQLKRSVLWATVLSILAAALGFFLMMLMTVVDARAAVGILRLAVYHVLWLIPIAMLTSRIRK